MSTLRDDVVKMIMDTCHPLELDLSDHDKPLLETGMDSLDFASILTGIEEKFDVELPNLENIENYGTVNSIVDVLERKE